MLKSVLIQRRSHSVLTRPLAGDFFILGTVRLVLVGNVWNIRVVEVRVRHQSAYTKQSLLDCHLGTPLVLTKANSSVRVDVRVVYFSDELDFRILPGVIRREVDVEEKKTTREGGVIWSYDGCLPVEVVGFVLGASRAVGKWVLVLINKFFLDALQ